MIIYKLLLQWTRYLRSNSIDLRDDLIGFINILILEDIEKDKLKRF